MPRKRWRSILFWLLFAPVALVFLFLFACNLWVVASTKSRVHTDPGTIDARPLGVVLGTSKKVGPNTPNQHFENRLTAAAELFSSGKVERLLVSGHRDSEYYDETRDMIAKLRELGVPEEFLISDDQGARTYDSMKRVREVFQVDRIVIVSDDFHVNRALFLADRLGLDAIALSSAAVDRLDSRKVRIREYFARVKAILDLYIWKPAPARASGSLSLG